jgi:hypothetical protein
MKSGTTLFQLKTDRSDVFDGPTLGGRLATGTTRSRPNTGTRLL